MIQFHSISRRAGVSGKVGITGTGKPKLVGNG